MLSGALAVRSHDVEFRSAGIRFCTLKRGRAPWWTVPVPQGQMQALLGRVPGVRSFQTGMNVSHLEGHSTDVSTERLSRATYS